MNSASRTEGALGLRKSIDFAGRESLGARETQEDYSLFLEGPSGAQLLAVLADGMGGHTGGEVASKLAVDAFVATFHAYPSVSVPVKLGAALQEANNKLASRIKNAPALADMGCTIVGLFIDAAGLQWISVGDSPLFLYRNKRVTRLNADHSMAPVIEESRRKGRITNEEAISHPNRNVLRSALMGESLAMIDTSNVPTPLCKGDIVILASDGLLSLSESEIAAVVIKHPEATAENLAQTLIAAVQSKKKPRQDNATVQVVIVPNFLGVPGASKRRLRWFLGVLVAVVIVAICSLAWQEKWAVPTALREVFLKQDPVVVPQPVRVPEDTAMPPRSGAAPQDASPEAPAKAPPSVNSTSALKTKGSPQSQSTVQTPLAPAKGAEGAVKGKPTVVHEDGAKSHSPAVQNKSMEPQPSPGSVPPDAAVVPKGIPVPSIPIPPGAAQTGEDAWSAFKRGDLAEVARILLSRYW